MDDYGDDCRGKVAELEARLAAAEARAEKAEEALPDADVVRALRWIYEAEQLGINQDATIEYIDAVDVAGNWLSTLPTPEAQP